MGAFIFCLVLGIELGLVCGIAIDVVLLMYYHWRPSLDVKYVNVSAFYPFPRKMRGLVLTLLLLHGIYGMILQLTKDFYQEMVPKIMIFK